MRVYHSSNVKIDVLKVGSHVTTNQNISQCFGRDKQGEIHYCHVFEARERHYPSVWNPLLGCRVLDIHLVGELDLSHTPDGEDWRNYTTAVELIPGEVIEY